MIRRIAFAAAAAKGLLIAWFVIHSLAARAQDAAPTNNAATLATRIDAQLDDSRFNAASWGVKVVSIDTGKTVYQRNAERLLVPASTAKLFTAALALHTFGSDYRIPTMVFGTKRPAKNGELHGDLVLYGYGDPTLGIDRHSDWANTLAMQIRKAGVTRVTGDLVADATRYAAPLYGSGWEAADLQHWFGAPASAISVDDNTVKLSIKPGVQPGQLARIEFDPKTSAPSLDNRLRTVPARTPGDISLIRRPGSNTLYAFGSIAANAGEQNYRVALADPALVAAIQLRQALADVGVAVSGKLRSVYWPAVNEKPEGSELIKLASDWSPPLSEIVRRGLKVSQNLYLQNLLMLVGASESDKRIAAQEEGARPLAFRSSETLGIDAMRRFVGGLGISPREVELEEGAGLSRRDLTTASAMTRLLTATADDPKFLALRQALPEAGVDGTLIGRMRKSAAKGQVFAKTGSMSMNYALAGYATTTAGERLAFALLLNNYAPNGTANARASSELDNIAVMLAELGQQTIPAR
ncbi:MAG: D-alanyl-D-alanine carboxypeptidase/D-alanyl-D-alanine-endopeptidase [Dokdonella sp.]